MSKLKNMKLLPICIAISAVILLAGIVLMGILGFNRSADRPDSYTIEVGYNVVVKNDEEKVETLEDICTEAFKDAGVKVSKVENGTGDGTSQDWTVIRYIFSGSTSSKKLTDAKSKIDAGLTAAFSADAFAETQVDIHKNSNLDISYPLIWRGGVALAVGVVVALAYVCIRFGVANAITGLTFAAHDALFTVCLFAILRIPTYAVAPVLYAAIAAIVSVVLWCINCMKLREMKKDPAFKGLSAEETVQTANRGARKTIITVAVALAAVIVLIGAIATAGVRTLALPALIPVAAAVYSSLLFAPALHVHVKKFFDTLAANRKPHYSGKKKQDKVNEE